jgi:N-acyl-D-aspartate/D-glutamate deacylase
MYHPRGYGSFAKVIHRYVMEQKTLSIEEAVYKMSGLPAKTIGLADRGILKVGNKADIIIFDPEKIYDIATFSHPHRLAKGFDWIWVNGELARRNGSFTDSRSGEVLRKNGRPNREK